MRTLICVALLLFSQSGFSAWFESEGEALLINGDVGSARHRAIKDAVKQALLFSGASISSLQQITKGVIEKDRFEIQSRGEIKGLRINHERIINGTLYVSVHVDIVTTAGQCMAKKFAKSLALVRFKLNNREQAINGSLFHIGSEFTGKLNNQMSLDKASFDVRQFVDENVAFRPTLLDSLHQEISSQVQSLASRTDSQYVLYGIIEDLSVELKDKLSYQYWFKDTPRNFFLKTYLFDGLSGELITVKNYRTRAKWDYHERDIVDLNSKQFWDTQYGQVLLNVMEEVIIDTDSALSCISPVAKIIGVQQDKVQINLGRKNGLDIGQKLTLRHNSSYIDQFGIPRNRSTDTQLKARVIELYQDSAVLQTLDGFPTDNIQLNDFATLN